MRRLFGAPALALAMALAPLAASAADRPDWAFPVTDKVQPPIKEDTSVKTAPGSTLELTRAQIDDAYNPPDWFPDMHPPMPEIVRHGNKDEKVLACALCHLPTGTGHDESAFIAGLPAGYTIRQFAEYKNGERKGAGTMINMSKTITDDELREAAGYFAAVKPRPWITVVETDTVPKTYIGKGNKRLVLPGGDKEAIGHRIIEVPLDEEIVLNRDPRSGFVAYVPKGAIAKGKALVTTGGHGKTIACAICHGQDLHGIGEVPGIAGRHPDYIVRQLWNLQTGERTGSWAVLMNAVVEKLSVDDMLDIAAYVAAQNP
jgi:cytochrome c553